MLAKNYSATTISRIIKSNTLSTTPTFSFGNIISNFYKSNHSINSYSSLFNNNQQKQHYNSISAAKLIETINKNEKQRNQNTSSVSGGHGGGFHFNRRSNRNKTIVEFIQEVKDRNYYSDKLIDKIHRYLDSKIGKIDSLNDVDKLLDWYTSIPEIDVDRIRLNLFLQYYSEMNLHDRVIKVYHMFNQFKVEKSLKTYQHLCLHYCKRCDQIVQQQPAEQLQSEQSEILQQDILALQRLLSDLYENQKESLEKILSMSFEGNNNQLIAALIDAHLTVGNTDVATKMFDSFDEDHTITSLKQSTLEKLFQHSLVDDIQRCFSIMRHYFNNRDKAFQFLTKQIIIVNNNTNNNNIELNNKRKESFKKVVDLVLEWDDTNSNTAYLSEFLKFYDDSSILLHSYSNSSTNLKKFPLQSLILQLYQQHINSKNNDNNNSSNNIELYQHTVKLIDMIIQQSVQLSIESAQAIFEMIHHYEKDQPQSQHLESLLNHISYSVSNNHNYDIANLVVYNTSASNNEALQSLVDFIKIQAPFNTDKITNQIIQVFLQFGSYHHAIDWMVMRTKMFHLPRHLLSTINFEIYHHVRLKSLQELLEKSAASSSSQSNKELEIDISMEKKLLEFWKAFNTHSKKNFERLVDNFVTQRKSTRGLHIHLKLHGQPLQIPSRPRLYEFKKMIDSAVSEEDAKKIQHYLSDFDTAEFAKSLDPALLINGHVVLSSIMDPLKYIQYRNTLSKDTRLITFHPLPYKNSFMINLNETFDIMREEHFLLLTASNGIWNALTMALFDNSDLYFDDGVRVLESMLENHIQFNMRTVDVIANAFLERGLSKDPLLERLPFAEFNDSLRNCKLRNLIDDNKLDEAEQHMYKMNISQMATVRLGIELLFKKYGVDLAHEKIFQHFHPKSYYPGHFYTEFFEALMKMEVGRNDIVKQYIDNNQQFFGNENNLNVNLIDLMIRSVSDKNEKLNLFVKYYSRLGRVNQRFFNRISKLNYIVKDPHVKSLLQDLIVIKEEDENKNKKRYQGKILSDINLNFLRSYFQQKNKII